MEEYIDRLIATLSSKHMTMPNDTEARILIRQQPELYRKFAECHQSVGFTSALSSGSLGATDYVSKRLFSAVEFLNMNTPTSRVDDGKITVHSTMPLLTDAAFEALREFVMEPVPATRWQDEAAFFAYLALGALLQESSTFAGNPMGVSAPTGSDATLLDAAMARYGAVRSVDHRLPRITHRFAEQVGAARATVERLTADTEKQLLSTSVSAADLETKVATSQETLKTLDAEIENTVGRLRSYEVTVRQELQLDRARETWGERYREAKQSFDRSWWIIGGYVGVTLIAAFVILYFVLPVFAAMPVSDNATIAITQQLGRLVVITLPVFVFLWTLRAVMRFHMRSMLLMDDARQRETMLDTYFLLTEQGRADERDRPMILWALFKQAPGHGPDGIEPPDFTEVINAGLSRAKGD